MIRIREIDHVVLRTSKLDAMIKFYFEVLGCSVERPRPEIGLTQLRAGKCLVDLSSSGTPVSEDDQRRNMDHLCFRIDPFEPDEIAREMGLHGIEASNADSRYGAEG